MAQRVENRSIDDAVELLKEHGFDGLAEAVTVLLNSAMVAERSESQVRPTLVTQTPERGVESGDQAPKYGQLEASWSIADDMFDS